MKVNQSYISFLASFDRVKRIFVVFNKKDRLPKEDLQESECFTTSENYKNIMTVIFLALYTLKKRYLHRITDPEQKRKLHVFVVSAFNEEDAKGLIQSVSYHMQWKEIAEKKEKEERERAAAQEAQYRAWQQRRQARNVYTPTPGRIYTLERSQQESRSATTNVSYFLNYLRDENCME